MQPDCQLFDCSQGAIRIDSKLLAVQRPENAPFLTSPAPEGLEPKRTTPTARENKPLGEGSQALPLAKVRHATEPAEILDVECERVSDAYARASLPSARHGPGYRRPLYLLSDGREQ